MCTFEGFGNRENDSRAYQAVGVPLSRIFLVNHRGEVTAAHHPQLHTRYGSLARDLLDYVFPAIARPSNEQAMHTLKESPSSATLTSMLGRSEYTQPHAQYPQLDTQHPPEFLTRHPPEFDTRHPPEFGTRHPPEFGTRHPPEFDSRPELYSHLPPESQLSAFRRNSEQLDPFEAEQRPQGQHQLGEFQNLQVQPRSLEASHCASHPRTQVGVFGAEALAASTQFSSFMFWNAPPLNPSIPTAATKKS